MKNPLYRAVARIPALSAIPTLCSLLGILAPNAAAQIDLDTDNNDLADTWEIKYFGSKGQDKDADTDGDGRTNLEECGAHTNPMDAGSIFKLVDSKFDADEQLLTFTSVVGKRYHIELSSDLSGWTKMEESAGTPLDFFGSGGQVTVDLATPASPAVTGACSRQVWFSTPATGTSDLEAFFGGAGAEAGSEWRASLKGPSDYGEGFSARTAGFITPKETGDYTFYIAGRGVCELHLNPAGDAEAGAALIAEIDSDTHADALTGEEDWDYLDSIGETDTQKSAVVSLTAGTRYFFEVLHVARSGQDHIAVGWQTPSSGPAIEVVPGECLSPLGTFASSNAATLLAAGPPNFVRVITYGPGDALALDSDGDGIDDASENELIAAGFSPFSSSSAGHGGGADDVHLAALIAFDSGSGDKEVISVAASDNEGIELLDPPLLAGNIVDVGSLGSQSGDSTDGIRFRISRSQGLEPVTVNYTLGGGTVAGEEVDATVVDDYTAAEEGGAAADGSVEIPALSSGVDIEITVKKDDIHEYPETVSCSIDGDAAYDIAGGAGLAKGEICDMPGDVNLLFVGAYVPDYKAAAGSTSANGSVSAYMKGDKRLFVLRNDNFANLSTPQIDTHIHKANLDGGNPTGGSPVTDILDNLGESRLGHYLSHDWDLTNTTAVNPTAGGSPSRQVIIDSFFNQNGETHLYVNLHTVNNMLGEVMAIFELATGSVSAPDPPDDPPAIDTVEFPLLYGDDLERDIIRFLNQATFGAVDEEVQALKTNIETERAGNPNYSRLEEFEKWIDEQITGKDQTFLVDYVLASDNMTWNLRGFFDPAEWNDWDPHPGPPTDPEVPDNAPDPAPWPANWPYIDRSLTNAAAPGMPNTHPHFWANQWYPVHRYPLDQDWINWRDDDTAGEGSKVLRNLGENNQDSRRWAHWALMVNSHDQLRQKWGYAIQQILVTSETLNDIRQRHLGAANYQDMLNYYGLPTDRDSSGTIESNELTYFRDLIGFVNWSPVMGNWLSSIKNRAAYDSNGDDVIDVYPDENLAREDMQLFTIGLFNLWLDGSLQLQSAVDPNVPPGSSATYDNDDIQEFARVLTGQSYSRYVNDSESDFIGYNDDEWREGPYQWGIEPGVDKGEVFDTDNTNDTGDPGDPSDSNDGDDGIRYNYSFGTGTGNKYYGTNFLYPMRMFGTSGSGAGKIIYHDLGVKTIAGGRVIDNTGLLSNQASPEDSTDASMIQMGVKDIEDAMDWFGGKVDGNPGPDFSGDAGGADSSHSATPPFISRRLIQRMVTSNPSSAYLYRVSKAFKDSEGSMVDVCKAVLLDYEARHLGNVTETFGMKKSPLEAYMQLLRTFDAHSLLPLRDDSTQAPFDGSWPAADGGYDPGSYTGQDQYHEIFLTDYAYPADQADNFRQNCLFQFIQTDNQLSMTPYAQETVFNFYLPDYTTGVVQSAALVSPELQLATETNVVQNINFFWDITWAWDTNRDRRQDGDGVNALGDSSRNQREAFTAGGTASGDWDHHSRVRIDMVKWADLIYDSSPFVARDIPASGGRTSESLEDEALVDFIDMRLNGGTFKAKYPFDESDDENTSLDGFSPRNPLHGDGDLTNDLDARNPRELIIHALTDSYDDGTAADDARRDKFRTALYLMSISPEFMVKK